MSSGLIEAVRSGDAIDRGLIIQFFDEEPAMYKYTTTFSDKFYLDANFSDASSPILVGERPDDLEYTPFQVADVRHCPEQAAALIISWWGPGYYLSGDEEIDEDADTYDGMTKDEYIESLILDVECLDEDEEDE
jgi:hypothetical protein